jgi:16S rRNA (guanine(527)-N(7))-methyltransferase RsmG
MLRDLVRRAGIPPGSEPERQMSRYLALLEKWNARVNLTASTEWQALRPLFEEAVWAAGRYEMVTHLDIGSGAGFPALPLRILVPHMQLEMIESRAKRCLFLETVVQDLKLANVRVINERLGAFLEARRGSWDCISWKAVKLSARDIRALAERATPQTRFWMFHGSEPAVEDPGILQEELVLERRESCPAREGWRLSIYRRRCFT